MIRFLIPAMVLLAMGLLGKGLSELIRSLRPKRRRGTVPERTGYQWERRTEQLYRRAKAVSVPGEDREAIAAFIESRHGVEAYVEPRTLMYPLSVVLVAGDGEWARFQLRDDSFIRDVAGRAGLPVYDAAKVGYPDRMRRYRRDAGRKGEDGNEGPQ